MWVVVGHGLSRILGQLTCDTNGCFHQDQKGPKLLAPTQGRKPTLPCEMEPDLRVWLRPLAGQDGRSCSCSYWKPLSFVSIDCFIPACFKVNFEGTEG